MPRKSKSTVAVPISPVSPQETFHRADILFVLEWASVAPGLGGWNVLLDNEQETRKVSVVPPGTGHPAFFITRSGSEVALHRYRPGADPGQVIEFARYSSLREAVLTVCALSGEEIETINEAMELLYPRSLRSA